MRAVASGVALSRTTGKDPVVIWHCDPLLNAPFKAIFLDKHLPFELRETGDIKYLVVYEMPRKKNLYVSSLIAKIDRKRRLFINDRLSAEGLKEVERTVSIPDEDTIIHSGQIFYPIDSALMNSIFRITDAVRVRINEILKGRKPDIALQIRRTDNVNSIKGSPLTSFEEIADTILCGSDSEIFLATDDETTKQVLQARCGERLIINPRPASRRCREGIIDACAELYILASCSHIFGSYWSSFSEIAALIGETALTVVRNQKIS